MAAMIPDKIKAGKAFMERMMKDAALSVKEEAEFPTGVSEGFNGPHAPGMGGGALPALGRFGCFFPEGEAFQAISSPMM